MKYLIKLQIKIFNVALTREQLMKLNLISDFTQQTLKKL